MRHALGHWLASVIHRLSGHHEPRPSLDPDAVRADLARRDPDYRYAREIKHDLENLVTMKRGWEQLLADERLRAQWFRRLHEQSHD